MLLSVNYIHDQDDADKAIDVGADNKEAQHNQEVFHDGSSILNTNGNNQIIKVHLNATRVAAESQR